MSKFQLDFSIYSSKDRMEAIKNIDLSSLTKTELETVTNYVLYGKDEDDTSCVDRKEIQIKSKFNSYNKDKHISLDELMESPTFDENIFLKNKTIYKKVKPSIDRDKAAQIPGMEELWKEIEKMDRILKENTGELEKTKDTPTLNTKQIYYLKHQLIELRTQQYYLMDSYFPTIQIQRNKAEFHGNIIDSQMNYPILPRGTMSSQDDQLFKFPKLDDSPQIKIYTEGEVEEIKETYKPYFDFRDPLHIYQLIQHYEEIKDCSQKNPDSPLNNLLWTLDFYIDKANLSEQQLLIIRDKKLRIPNKEIAQHLHDELGIYHQENYISTIWNKCVNLITEAVELNYDEYLCRNYDKAWKKCTRCGEYLLRDSRNFVKKAKAADGLTSRCKKCDKEIRQLMKK